MNRLQGCLLGMLLCISVYPISAQTSAHKEQDIQAITIAFNTSLTTSLLLPPNISGVINDPTDPASTLGIIVDVQENGSPIAATDYTITASSNKTSVVPNANVVITKANGNATVKITPAGVGYATITLTLTKGSNTKTLQIKYASSAASATPASTYWHTGASDASAFIALDDDYMVMGDDEMNYFFVYKRMQSGLPVKSFYYGDLLGLTDGSTGNYKEVDLESCVRSKTIANRVYWLGSMSNAGSSNEYKPNSNKFFATTITGTGNTTNFTVNGYYSNMRQQLISWGDSYGYNFSASTASGHDAKTIDGFNAEGMNIAPDNTTLYIGFRAPLVPTANRTKAVIAPLLNFETWFNNGNPLGNPTFGAPIELNLGGRGIRDMVRLSNGVYIIVAGNYDNVPVNGAIYKWTGVATDAPVQVTTMNITALNAEACLEMNVGGQPAMNKLQVISDNGSFEFYNDGTEAKDLSQNTYKKFRDDIITAPSDVLPIQLDLFNADKREGYVLLSWQTTHDDNIVLFNIERSLNGVDFSTIGTVLSNNTHQYQWKDEHAIDGATYYRIRIKEKSGGYYYSTIRTVNTPITKKVSIYPNPVTNNTFSIATNTTSNKQVIILDATGALYKTLSFSSATIDVNATQWAKGNYFIQITGENGLSYSRQIIVQ